MGLLDLCKKYKEKGQKWLKKQLKLIILNGDKQTKNIFQESLKFVNYLNNFNNKKKKNLNNLPGIRNIIKFYDCKQTETEFVYHMEWCESNLNDYFKKNRGLITEQTLKKWIKQLGEALIFLQDVMKVTHRDLKLDNIMIDKDQNLKLIDFTLAKETIDVLNNQVEFNTRQLDGFKFYKSPERLNQESKYDNFKSDLWSVGVIIYYLFFGKFPFVSQGDNDIQIDNKHKRYFKILNLYEQDVKEGERYYKLEHPSVKSTFENLFEPNKHISPEGQQLLRKIFQEQQYRINFQQFIEDPWLPSDKQEQEQQDVQAPTQISEGLYFIYQLIFSRQILKTINYLQSEDQSLLNIIQSDQTKLSILVNAFINYYTMLIDKVNSIDMKIMIGQSRLFQQKEEGKELYNKLWRDFVMRYQNEKNDQEFRIILKQMQKQYQIDIFDQFPIEDVQDIYEILQQDYQQIIKQANFQASIQHFGQLSFFGYWKLLNNIQLENFDAKQVEKEEQELLKLLQNTQDQRSIIKRVSIVFPVSI